MTFSAIGAADSSLRRRAPLGERAWRSIMVKFGDSTQHKTALIRILRTSGLTAAGEEPESGDGRDHAHRE